MYLKQIALRATPVVLREPLRALRDRCLQATAIGSAHHCPICERRFGRFLSGGVIKRAAALCPMCRSLERHRLVWLYLRNATDLFDARPKRMLHFAPETCLAERFRRLPNLDYVTADLASDDARVRLDITRLPFADGTFEVIYCSHVLEHIDQDRQAMAEIARVLHPDGWALLLVPIEGQTTYEDPSITTPQARHRAFRQEDHVRLYGRDFADRLAAAGLSVTAVPYATALGAQTAAEMGLAAADIVHFCRKDSAR